MPVVNKSTCEIAIAGGGPAGLLCALLLAGKGVQPLLIASSSPPQPGRTVALMQGSLELLREAGVLEQVRGFAEPLRAIRLVDDTGSIFRAPVTTLEACELGLDAFGLNMPNDTLQDALEKMCAYKRIERITGTINTVTLNDDRVQLSGNDFSVEARLVIAADGRRSKLRDALQLKMKRQTYPQTAVTAVFSHSAPHKGISTEFHTRCGPFTLVPLPDNCSSLVAVTTHDDATHLASLPDEQLCREAERRCQHLLGKMTCIGPRGSWPLEMALPQSFAAQRVMLAGEAAHVLPPIGAQGLNLGLRDAHAAAQLAGDAVLQNIDPGSFAVLKAYNQNRGGDIRTRSFAVDLFNRSLLTPFLPIHLLRGLGLALAGSNTVLRRNVIKAGLGADQIAVK